MNPLAGRDAPQLMNSARQDDSLAPHNTLRHPLTREDYVHLIGEQFSDLINAIRAIANIIWNFRIENAHKCDDSCAVPSFARPGV